MKEYPPIVTFAVILVILIEVVVLSYQVAPLGGISFAGFNCGQYRTAPQCEAAGCIWTGSSCVSPPTILCESIATQLQCQSSGCYWYNNACHSGSQTPPQVGACFNGVLDGRETDVDCGDGCQKCSSGKRCLLNTDCVSSRCLPSNRTIGQYGNCL